MVGGLAIHLQNKNDYRDEIKEDLISTQKKNEKKNKFNLELSQSCSNKQNLRTNYIISFDAKKKKKKLKSS